MWLKAFIARRYIGSQGSHSVVNTISRVSRVAMAAPVAAIVVLLAVFSGLESLVGNLYRAIDPDISITPIEGTTFVEEQELREKIAQSDGVESLCSTLTQGAMAEYGDRRTIVEVCGVDSLYGQTLDIGDHIIEGTLSTQLDQSDSIVAALMTLQRLGLGRKDLGEQITLYSINRSRFSSLLLLGAYNSETLPLAGCFSSLYAENSQLLLTSLRAAQRLFNYKERISSWQIAVAEGYSPEEVKQSILSLLNDEQRSKYRVQTRYESNSLYRLMALEKWGVFAVAALVMGVALLSIVGALVMTIIEKRDDIETLSTLGARRDFILSLFRWEGRMMAAWSIVVGLAVGLALCLIQHTWGVVRLDAPSLMVDAYPVELRWGDVAATIALYALLGEVIIRITIHSMLRGVGSRATRRE